MTSSSTVTPAPTVLATSTAFDFLMDPASVIAVLWRGRLLILGCMAACLALAGLYLLVAKRQYQATVKLLVLDSGNAPLGGAEAARLIRGVEDEIPTHAALVSSPVVLRRAVESIGLNNLPSLGGASGLKACLRNVAESVTVGRPDRQAKILQVACRARTKAEAVRVVKAVAESYQFFLEEVYARNNGDIVVLMTRARDDLNSELKDLERKYFEFRQNAPQLTGDGAGRSVVHHRIDEWDKASREVMVKAVQLKAQLELGHKLSSDGVGLWSIAYALDHVAGGGGLGAKTQGLGPAPPSEYLRMLANEQQKLAETLGPQSTKVKEIQEQIASVQAASRQTRGHLEEIEIHDLLASIETSLKSIESMRKEIQTKFDSDLKLAKKVEIDQLAESNLKNEMERQRKLFDTVVEQLKRSTLVGDFSGTRSHIIEPPNAEEEAVRPRTTLTWIMSLAAGCVLGMSVALGAEMLDPRVKSLAEMRRVLGLPVLGQVPFVLPGHAPKTAPVGLICQAMPRSPSAEAYRVVRANLELARRGREARLLMVTGPHDAEGKSTVASNLAVALAQAGRRVLLVDANLRKPTQHVTFGLSRERGLVHLLRDLLPLNRIVQTTTVNNLDLIASGPSVAQPAELLSSPSLDEVIGRLRVDYDAVIIDAPSLLNFADPSILGSVVDGIIMVVRVGATKRADVTRAVETLKGLGTPLLGAIINGASPDMLAWPWPSGSQTATNEISGVTNGLFGTSAGVLTPSEIPYDPRISFALTQYTPTGNLFHESGSPPMPGGGK